MKNEDEQNCLHYGNRNYHCNNRKCVRSDSRCASYNDCGDFSDEVNCISCSSYVFHCTKKKCTQYYGFCDRIENCTENNYQNEVCKPYGSKHFPMQ